MYPNSYSYEPTAADLAAGTATPESIQAMSDIFESSGILHLRDIFSPSTIAAMVTAWETQYPHLVAGTAPAASDETILPVGDRRVAVPIELSGPLSQPATYANAFLLPLVRALLGPRCVLNNVTCVVSYPGAKAQHQHLDQPPLFDLDIGARLPCYALTVAVPLVDLDEATGTTALWPGSHRDERALSQEPVLPLAPVGSAYLMDCRTTHQGMPNLSDKPRPILYFVYTRPWYRDDANFWRFNPRLLPADGLAQVPPHLQHLFAGVAPHLDRPFSTRMPQMRSALALLEENERSYEALATDRQPLPALSLEEADARLFELVQCTFGDADPRLARPVEALRRYIEQANQWMARNQVGTGRRGEAIKEYLAQVMVADFTSAGPRHAGLYVAAAQRIRAHAEWRAASYRLMAHARPVDGLPSETRPEVEQPIRHSYRHVRMIPLAHSPR